MNGWDIEGCISSVIVAKIILNVAGYIFAWAFTKYKIRKNYSWSYKDALDLTSAILSGLIGAFVGKYVSRRLSKIAVAIDVGVRAYVISMIWNGPPKNLKQVWRSTKEVIFSAIF